MKTLLLISLLCSLSVGGFSAETSSTEYEHCYIKNVTTHNHVEGLPDVKLPDTFNSYVMGCDFFGCDYVDHSGHQDTVIDHTEESHFFFHLSEAKKMLEKAKTENLCPRERLVVYETKLSYF